MLFEVAQIQAWLRKHAGEPCPDGDYTIPLGVSKTPTLVRVRDGKLSIAPSPSGKGKE